MVLAYASPLSPSVCTAKRAPPVLKYWILAILPMLLPESPALLTAEFYSYGDFYNIEM